MTLLETVIYYHGGETKSHPFYGVLFFVFLLFAVTANLGACACSHMWEHVGHLASCDQMGMWLKSLSPKEDSQIVPTD